MPRGSTALPGTSGWNTGIDLPGRCPTSRALRPGAASVRVYGSSIAARHTAGSFQLGRWGSALVIGQLAHPGRLVYLPGLHH